MYQNCIFCSAALGANDVVERFPVGRTLAFDGEKGRLWAVCPSCARWNLAPLEERWEAIDDAERLFRDTRLRAQSENIGLARLADGTRLIRVGSALAGELAVWRYGEGLLQRGRRTAILTGLAAASVTGIVFSGGLTAQAGLGMAMSAGAAQMLVYAGTFARQVMGDRRVVAHVGREDGVRFAPRVLRWRDLRGAMVSLAGDGQGLRISSSHAPDGPLELEGEPARRLLTRAMPLINAAGARRPALDSALRRLESVPTPEGFLHSRAQAGFQLLRTKESAPERLAVEMALHEEFERRVMQGELAALESMWREAEQIADIADRLPDVPASDPPRLGA